MQMDSGQTGAEDKPQGAWAAPRSKWAAGQQVYERATMMRQGTSHALEAPQAGDLDTAREHKAKARL